MACESRRMFSIPTSSKTKTLPVSSRSSGSSNSKQEDGGLRRRLSSISFGATSSFPSYRSKSSISFSSMGDYAGRSLRKWWDCTWGWILSRKPIFATDLEMNEQETKMLGSNEKGSWRHVFCRLRSEIRRRFHFSHHYVALPQTYKQQQ